MGSHSLNFKSPTLHAHTSLVGIFFLFRHQLMAGFLFIRGFHNEVAIAIDGACLFVRC